MADLKERSYSPECTCAGHDVLVFAPSLHAPGSAFQFPPAVWYMEVECPKCGALRWSVRSARVSKEPISTFQRRGSLWVRLLRWMDGKRSGKINRVPEPIWPGNVTQSRYLPGKYVGEFKDGKQHGQGTYTWHSGSKYVGEWKDGTLHGEGTYTYFNGNKYVGEWRDGSVWEGTNYDRAGMLATWSDGIVKYRSKYVGELKDGKKHGHGTETWGDEREYVGEFKDGERHGYGTVTLLDGGEIVGEWKDGEIQGHATLTWPHSRYDRGKYIGEFKDDKRHGQGALIRADGSKYVGEWKDGVWAGQGSWTPKGRASFVGEWKGGRSHGQGTQTEVDGGKTVGEWKHGMMWEGTVYGKDGSVAQRLPGDLFWFEGMGINTDLYQEIVNSSDFRKRRHLLKVKHNQQLREAIGSLKSFYRKQKPHRSGRNELNVLRSSAVALEVAVEKGIITNSQADTRLEKVRVAMDKILFH